MNLFCGFEVSLIFLLPFLEKTISNRHFDYLETFGDLGPKTHVHIAENAVKDLIERLIGNDAVLFNVTIDPELKINYKDVFKLFKSDDEEIVYVTGSSGVAAAWGFHHYLKEYCMCHVSWDGNQIQMPPVLPLVNICIEANDWFRYYQNVCTTSYSFVWWDWARWEKEIDWMAMNGFNLALAFNGQEEIWRRVYLKLGLTQEEIANHFSGPAFLSWNRMGNMRGWGGPLPQSWHNRSVRLQRKILSRMRELGITPVLPAFAGHVPRAFKRIFPNASLTLLPKWNSFSDEYCCPYLLSPGDPIFNKIGSAFLTEYIEEFGTDHIYNCDTFNEMAPSSGDPEYLRSIGKEIYKSMTTIDPKALWMIQGWLFKHEFLFWTKKRVQALLTSVPTGKMIVLDLQAELSPQYRRFNSFFGQPFIWCMLHNFGGTLGLHGSVEKINYNVFEARDMLNSTMVGAGITPEGINQNYVIYDLMMDMFWRKEPANLTIWFNDYSVRRYGEMNRHAFLAWNYLKSSVYNYSGTLAQHGKYTVVRHPALNIITTTWYNESLVYEAWKELLLAAYDMAHYSGTFKVDVVDVTRQGLQLIIDGLYENIRESFFEKNITAFQIYSESFLSVLDDMETILAANPMFLLGKWVNSAKEIANNPEEEELYEMNAKNQVTLWGPNGEIRDYANKQWSGLVKDYYKPRWEIFLSALNISLVEKKPFNQREVSAKIFLQVEMPFTLSHTIYPEKATGNPIDLSKFMYGRWIQR